jgi:exonuclease VII small subunit
MKKVADSKEEINLGENLKKLAKIVEWLEAQERSDEPDFDEGLAKVREAVALVQASRARLSEVENEFEEIRKGIEGKEKLP